MAAKGSSKNIRKRNPKRAELARETLREELADLRALEGKPNKTREDKIEIERRRKRVSHLRRKIESKSESHARTGKRH